MRSILLSGAASAIAATMVVPAAAQAPETASDDLAADIIVTANKREQSIIDVDSSITALSGADLADGGIQDTQQLVNATPNLIVQRSIIGKIHIRGIGNENYTIGGDPSVAVHSDGVYVARAAAGLFDLFDIDRVEVLRGPQGTLYGRNATGGVINVLPRTPTQEFEGYGTAEYGNYNHIRLEGALSGPLGGGLSARISGLGLWRDGFIRNVNAGARARGFGRLDNKNLWAVRGQIAYDNDGPFTARLAVEYIHDNSKFPPYVYLQQPAPFLPTIPAGRRTIDQGLETALPILGGAARSFGSDENLFKSYQLGVGLHMNLDLGGVTVNSITGFRNTKFNYLNDGDGTAAFFVNYGQQDDSDQYSQELRFASDNGGPFNWIVGGFYFREEGDTFIALPIRLSIFGLADDSITVDGTAKTTSFAAFTELYYQLTDQFKVTLGGRYTHEKRQTGYLYKALFAAPVQAPPATVGDPTPGQRTFKDFSPKLVLTYEPNSDTNVYASVTRGFKSGGFNLLALQPGFNPETIWNYELGFKSRLADGRVRIGASAFYSDFKDLQVGQIVNLQSVLTNAAQAEIYGVEAEVAVQATDAFEFGGSAAYLHANFTSFCTADPTLPDIAPQAGCTDAANPVNLSGFRLPRAPRFTTSGYAAYGFDLGSAGTLRARADARYQSRTFFTQFNRPTVAQDGYVVVNARLTWSDRDDRFSVGVWANNLFDKFYYNEVLESGAFNPVLIEQAYPGAPRTYGITASARF